MFRSRKRSSLTGVAHRIAMRFHEISKPFLDRGEETPRCLLAHEFGTICAEFDGRGGPLSTAEMKLLANKFVPQAMDRITKRIQRAADFVGGMADSMARENARAGV